MPADLAELARDVANLRVWQSQAGDIDARLSRIEEQLGDSTR